MSGRIPAQFIDELIARVDIVEIIGQRLELKRSGNEYKACCPFHKEKTASFYVSPSKQFYHCFGCGVHGSAIGFLMDHDHMGFVEAITQLADHTGLQIPRPEQGAAHVPKVDPSLYDVVTQVAQFFRQQLINAQHCQQYLQNRQINEQMAERFSLGYAPNNYQYLDNIDIAQEKLIEVGVLAKNDRGCYPRFRDRLIIPINDRRGRCIGFGGRVLGSGEPKYLNSPETELFHKGRELFGLYEARQHTRKLNHVLIVEGYLDLIALHQFGITNVVATLGTATTVEHLQLLFRQVERLVFCFDGDRAGRRAAWKALQLCLPLLEDGRNAEFLFLPDGEDPDSFVRDAGMLGLQAHIEQAMPLEEFFFSELGRDDNAQGIAARARMAQLAKPLIDSMPPGVWQTLFRQSLNTRLGLAQKTQRRALPAEQQQNASKTPMRMAIAVALQHPDLVAQLDDSAQTIPAHLPGAELWQQLCSQIKTQPDISAGALLERFRDSQAWRAFTQLAAYSPEGLSFDRDFAAGELQGALNQLRQKAKRGTAAQLPQRISELSEDDKAKLRRTYQSPEQEP